MLLKEALIGCYGRFVKQKMASIDVFSGYSCNLERFEENVCVSFIQP